MVFSIPELWRRKCISLKSSANLTKAAAYASTPSPAAKRSAMASVCKVARLWVIERPTGQHAFRQGRIPSKSAVPVDTLCYYHIIASQSHMT